MNIFAGDILFYVFGVLAVITSLLVVFMRNPVSSAMMMAISFGATAAIMMGLSAHFIGILQILVYAGAIMVLFTFIIMLLNVKTEQSPLKRPFAVAAGVIIASLFLGLFIGIVHTLPGSQDCTACPLSSAGQAWDDLAIGQDKDKMPADVKDARETVDALVGGLQTAKGLKIELPAISPVLAAQNYPHGTNIRKELEQGEFPDTALLGHTLFSKYNRALIIAGLALLVASIGVVVLSRKPTGK